MSDSTNVGCYITICTKQIYKGLRQLDKAIVDLVGEGGNYVESRGIVVFYGIDDDRCEACIVGDFTAMVVPAPIHIHAPLLKQGGQFVGLLNGVVGGMLLGVVSPKEVGMREDDGMTEGGVLSVEGCGLGVILGE